MVPHIGRDITRENDLAGKRVAHFLQAIIFNLESFAESRAEMLGLLPSTHDEFRLPRHELDQ
jgi:hypothetical protein